MYAKGFCNLLLFAVCFCVSVTTAFSERLPPVIDLRTDADIVIYGPGDPAHAGADVTVTDVNGDGYEDLVVGVCRDSGMVIILWGNGSLTQNGTVDLASASPPYVSRILGKPGDNAFWCSLSSGDFNMDGYGDIIIGEKSGLSSRGIAYVIFGSASFPDTLDLASQPANVVEIHGKARSLLGIGVCGCDLNGDGFDEIIVSAPALDIDEVYAIHGGTSFQRVYDMSQVSPGVTRIIDNNRDQHFGTSFGCGDFDGDGREDLLIGSPGGNIFDNYAGIVALLYGDSILPDTLDMGDPAYRKKVVLPQYAHGQLGYRVCVGDIDGDGLLDGILSAYLGDPLGCTDCGEVYVIYNMNEAPDSFAVSSPSVPMTRLLGGGNAFELWGVDIHCAEVSGDNIDDVIIASSPKAYPNAIEQVVIAYGGTLPDSVFLDTDSTVTRIWGAAEGEVLGLGLSSGDFNLDGQADVVMGAMFADPLGRSNAGEVYIVFGIPDTAGSRPSTVPGLTLFQNVPNPFSSTTVIDYDLHDSSPAWLRIYNVRGQHVAEIPIPSQPAGRHSITWNGLDTQGRRLASGIYFYELSTGPVSQARKMLLLR